MRGSQILEIHYQCYEPALAAQIVNAYVSESFTFVALLTLALGIGATTVIFSIVHAVLLQPLPFRDSNRLVVVWERNFARDRARNVVGPANFVRWRRRLKFSAARKNSGPRGRPRMPTSSDPETRNSAANAKQEPMAAR